MPSVAQARCLRYLALRLADVAGNQNLARAEGVDVHGGAVCRGAERCGFHFAETRSTKLRTIFPNAHRSAARAATEIRHVPVLGGAFRSRCSAPLAAQNRKTRGECVVDSREFLQLFECCPAASLLSDWGRGQLKPDALNSTPSYTDTF
jgi:hypothetical protein